MCARGQCEKGPRRISNKNVRVCVCVCEKRNKAAERGCASCHRVNTGERNKDPYRGVLRLDKVEDAPIDAGGENVIARLSTVDDCGGCERKHVPGMARERLLQGSELERPELVWVREGKRVNER